MIEEFVDGDLLFNAEHGSRSAIKTMARLSADLLRHIDAESPIACAMGSISTGEPPNIAFSWIKPPAKKPTNMDKRLVMDAATTCIASIEQKCRLSAGSLPSYLFDILSRIASGEAPNAAMRWETHRRGASKPNTTVRDWLIQKTFQDRLKAGLTNSKAIEATTGDGGGDFHLSAKRIKQITNGIAEDTTIEFPSSDVFPIEQVPKKRRF